MKTGYEQSGGVATSGAGRGCPRLWNVWCDKQLELERAGGGIHWRCNLMRASTVYEVNLSYLHLIRPPFGSTLSTRT
jgi:hypothetical protein